jgi:metal-sulfur cluster biosynthetic enzyme
VASLTNSIRFCNSGLSWSPPHQEKDLLTYLLIALPILLALGLLYATRRQARVNAASQVPEPEIDLTYRPPLEREVEAESERPVAKLRDPHLAQLSTDALVLEVLRECYDPEIPLNIVDLGLVYDVQLAKESLKVKMSLTAPGCPSGEQITLDVKSKLQEAGFPNPKVELVWDPPWTAQRISEEGRKILGI